MKKYLLTKIIYIVFMLCVLMSYKAYAIDITVGATTWYAWGNRYEDVQESSIRKNNNYAFDPSFLYGPVFSVKLNDDFNLTFVYLYSKFNYTFDYYKDEGGTLFIESKIKRSDSDLAVNYKLNAYLKLFLGAKYLAYDIKLAYVDYEGDYWNSHSNHTGIGPGLGLNATFPITDNIFLLGTLSGFYLFSTGEKFEDKKIYDDIIIPVKMTVGYNEYGFNSNISIAYYIAPASTVISIGARFQYFITDYYDYEPFLINKITNMFYGITLTATYTFSI